MARCTLDCHHRSLALHWHPTRALLDCFVFHSLFCLHISLLCSSLSPQCSPHNNIASRVLPSCYLCFGHVIGLPSYRHYYVFVQSIQQNYGIKRRYPYYVYQYNKFVVVRDGNKDDPGPLFGKSMFDRFDCDREDRVRRQPASR
ncbi:hypothetical protein JAAARDRAFT_345172 [Jaapia argillacea MUCL 33604]|uniref:Uncharacterized protein n=1 Tax=Jaapia argillacea MUCL 33604 TaxID=933084 RepID=A0A067PK90_9AGAM|nr:hypothetical protein JAAARDRAFT_345172 [Jaapia argillacea MUCL 33604]